MQKNIQLAGIVLWHIWKTRCQLVFDNIRIPVVTLSLQEKKFISDWDNSLSSMSINGRNVQGRTDRNVSWTVPMYPFMKINFDASFKKDCNKCGLGLIMRSFAGECGGAASIPLTAFDEEQAEALGALQEVIWAKGNNIDHLHLEGDNSNVIAALNGASTAVKWTTSSVIEDILVLLSSFNSWKCSYVPREANKTAHLLAKEAYNASNNLVLSADSDFPMWLKSSLEEDSVS
ncbi:uncharacterized protein LOC113360125 [Papaver somniferum]|uniref:uncharacterized protein LOC113360125 n=1 Tax=Papaver somniferum TaxID=3469 RepID=UPI000E70386A|nr:uncharacterized protein LOC113360125 [Papaver somniferum]